MASGPIILHIFSFVLLPLLRIWQLLPLAYFVYMGAAMRSWYHEMIAEVHQKPDSIDLQEIFNRFSCLTKINARMAEIFNPFITTSILFPMIQLGLAIYFVTNTDDILGIYSRPNMTDAAIHQATMRSGFELGWAALQVFIAVIFLIVICRTCWRCNEEVKQITFPSFKRKLGFSISYSLQPLRSMKFQIFLFQTALQFLSFKAKVQAKLKKLR